MIGVGIYDLHDCENVLIDEGYAVIRPEENLYLVEKFGKVFVVITDDDVDVVREIVNKVKNENELHAKYYCISVERL